MTDEAEQAAREWADKEYPWLRKSELAGEWTSQSTVSFVKAHLAGQAHGEKRERERTIVWWQEKTKQEFWTARDLLVEFLKEKQA